MHCVFRPRPNFPFGSWSRHLPLPIRPPLFVPSNIPSFLFLRTFFISSAHFAFLPFLSEPAGPAPRRGRANSEFVDHRPQRTRESRSSYCREDRESREQRSQRRQKIEVKGVEAFKHDDGGGRRGGPDCCVSRRRHSARQSGAERWIIDVHGQLSNRRYQPNDEDEREN